MTLCISAVCQDKGKPCIVVSSDWKAEVGEVASAEIQNKLYWLFNGKLAVLIAGTASSAHDLVATLKQEIKPKGLTGANIGDRLKSAVLKHRGKLIQAFVRARHNVTYEYFLSHKAEFPESQWTDTHSLIRKLPLQCQLIVCSFIKKDPFMFIVEDNADVWRDENFLAIGTGSTISNSVLCFRLQNEDYSLADTLYNVYEATRYARKAHTPGVGKNHAFSVLYPRKQRRLRGKGFRSVRNFFDKYGPHDVPYLSLPKDCWEEY